MEYFNKIYGELISDIVEKYESADDTFDDVICFDLKKDDGNNYACENFANFSAVYRFKERGRFLKGGSKFKERDVFKKIYDKAFENLTFDYIYENYVKK